MKKKHTHTKRRHARQPVDKHVATCPVRPRNERKTLGKHGSDVLIRDIQKTACLVLKIVWEERRNLQHFLSKLTQQNPEKQSNPKADVENVRYSSSSQMIFAGSYILASHA